MKKKNFIFFVSLLISGCQVFNSGNSSKPINMYPPKSQKIKFQQDWQYELYHKRIAGFKKVNAFKDGFLILNYMIKLFFIKKS